MRVKNQTREDSSFCPEISTKNAVQVFHLWNDKMAQTNEEISHFRKLDALL